MLKKILGYGSALVAGALVLVNKASAEVMSTTTLGSNIDVLNGTVVDYFNVLLEKYWPFVVGFVILVGVWYFGRRIINSFR